jgi:PAS domain S-box-containing protein
MPKRFIDPAWRVLSCLVLLIWQLSVPVYAQTQPQSAPDPKGVMDRSPGAGTASAQPDLASKKVLILHSFAFAQPVYKIIDEALIKSFVAGGLNFNNLYFEFLDLARNPGQNYRNELTSIFRQKYQERKFDLVVALHQQSLEFLVKEGQSFYPEGPIICILGDPVPDIRHSDSKRPLIYLPFSIDIISTVKAIFTLQPDTRKIVVIAGSAPVDRRFLDLVQAALKGWKGNLDVEFIPPLPLDDILKKVAELPTKTAILYTNVAADSTGKTYIPRDVALMISRSANAPVFGLYETLLGDNGIVGGIILNHRLEGERAVRSAMEILRGQLPSKPLTILPAPLVPMFDWVQLKRWGMNEAVLPADAMILNKPVSAWERYRIYIIAGMVICLAETLLIIFLIVQRRRKRSAEESQRKTEEKYRSIFEGAVEGIFESSPQGQPLTVNPALARLLGYASPEEFLSSVHETATDVWVNPNGRTEYVRLLEERNVVHGYEAQFWRKDRSKIWVSLSGRRVYGPEGRTILYSGFIEDITERKLADEALEDRLRFEALLSDLSARFILVSPEETNREIEHALNQIMAFFQVDRCALLRISKDKGSFEITHLVQREKLFPLPVNKELPASMAPWVCTKILDRKVVAFKSLGDLPAEASIDKQTYEAMGIKANLNIPVVDTRSDVYSLVLNSIRSERVWPEVYIPRLRVLGEILGNALLRKKTEEATRESERVLRENENELRGLAGRLIYAQEEERSRLARELHDDLAQRLTVFAIDVGRLEQQLTDSPAPVREELREMQNSIVRISQDVHSLSRQLHPSILDDLGLIKAAESECTSFSRREGIEVVFKHENIPRVIPKDVSLSLYRIIQEGLMNISKHACAEHISVSLKGIDHDVLLSVQDDGIGFDWAEVKENPGLGFSSMRERARLIHGELSIQSQPEKGTVITLRVPLARDAA